MTPLMRLLARRIADRGPLSVAEYMALALNHPAYGYYSTRDPLGTGGDFVTAPEVSQMFGELIGLWCVQCWRDAGAPSPFALVELGPGRGTLIADALRAARQVAPDFVAAKALHLVETSPALRARQEVLLGAEPIWHARFEEVPQLPLLLIANEFFDALPVRQLVRTGRGFCERCVGLAGLENGEPRLTFLAPGAPVSSAAVPEALRDCPVGSVIELRPAADLLVEAIAARLAAQGGIAALIIDYGYTTHRAGDTLQALHNKRFAHPLAQPGETDLTAHVDFEALAEAARCAGAAVQGPVTQGAFLTALGIEARAARLARGATQGEQHDIAVALHRLVDPQSMGALFKVMALTPRRAPRPAGFDA